MLAKRPHDVSAKGPHNVSAEGPHSVSAKGPHNVSMKVYRWLPDTEIRVQAFFGATVTAICYQRDQIGCNCDVCRRMSTNTRRHPFIYSKKDSRCFFNRRQMQSFLHTTYIFTNKRALGILAIFRQEQYVHGHTLPPMALTVHVTMGCTTSQFTARVKAMHYPENKRQLRKPQ